MHRFGAWLHMVHVQDVILYNREGLPLVKCSISTTPFLRTDEPAHQKVDLENGSYGYCYFYQDAEDVPSNICVFGKDDKGSSFSFRSIISH